MADETVIDRVAAVLAALDRDKPWVTARGLAKRLAADGGSAPGTDELREALMVHAGQEGRKIRYSVYPGRKTLDILWGHVDVVGERPTPDLRRADQPPEPELPDLGPGAPMAFISHNHRDYAQVEGLSRRLHARGIDAWTFESDIPPDEFIMDRVQDAVADSACLLLYLSANSLGSLWVAKEVEFALGRYRLHPVVVADGDDDRVVDLLSRWTAGWPPDRDLYRAVAEEIADAQPGGPRRWWIERSEEFLCALHEYVGGTGVVVLWPWPEARKPTPWQGAALRFHPVDALPELISA